MRCKNHLHCVPRHSHGSCRTEDTIYPNPMAYPPRPPSSIGCVSDTRLCHAGPRHRTQRRGRQVRPSTALCVMHAPVEAEGHHMAPTAPRPSPTAGLRHRPRPVRDRGRFAAKYVGTWPPPARAVHVTGAGTRTDSCPALAIPSPRRDMHSMITRDGAAHERHVAPVPRGPRLLVGAHALTPQRQLLPKGLQVYCLAHCRARHHRPSQPLNGHRSRGVYRTLR